MQHKDKLEKVWVINNKDLMNKFEGESEFTDVQNLSVLHDEIINNFANDRENFVKKNNSKILFLVLSFFLKKNLLKGFLEIRNFTYFKNNMLYKKIFL